jgi:hypothetical protein
MRTLTSICGAQRPAAPANRHLAFGRGVNAFNLSALRDTPKENRTGSNGGMGNHGRNRSVRWKPWRRREARALRVRGRPVEVLRSFSPQIRNSFRSNAMNFKDLHFVVALPTRENDRGGAHGKPQAIATSALSGLDYPPLAAIARPKPEARLSRWIEAGLEHGAYVLKRCKVEGRRIDNRYLLAELTSCRLQFNRSATQCLPPHAAPSIAKRFCR